MARKRATSLEVARAAGVSRTTVSLVLNDVPRSGIPEETRERVLQEATRLNYYPNVTGRRLARGRTNTLALVVHQNSELAAADLPRVDLNAAAAEDAHHGRPIPAEQVQGLPEAERGRVLAMFAPDGRLVALGRHEDGVLRVARGFRY